MKGNLKKNKNSDDQSSVLLYRISKAVAAVKDGRELIKIIVAETQSIFGFYDIGLSVLDKSGKFYIDWAVLYQKISPSETNLAMSETNNYKIPVDEPLYKYTLTRIAEEKKPFIENMTEEFFKKFEDFPHLSLEVEYGFKQFLVTTLKFGGKTLGILNFNSQNENHFENCDLELFQAIADLVAVAVANILANEEIIEREREKSVLLSISQAIATIQNAAQLFKVIFERIQPVFGFYDVGLFVLSKDGKQITDWAGESPEMSPSPGNQQVHQQQLQTLPFADSPLEFVSEELVRTGSPLIFGYDEDYLNLISDADFRAKMKTIIETGGYREFLATTLKTGGKTLGLLFFNSKTSGFFDAEKFGLFQVVTDQISVAVANILANEEILERTREKSVLLSISADIASVRNAVELLQIIRDKARQLIPFHDTGILIVEDDGKHHYDLAVNLVGWEDSPATQKLQSLYLNRILHSGSYVDFVMQKIETADSPIIEDYERRFQEFDYPFFEIMKELGYQEAIVGTLKSGGKTFGTFWLNSLEKNHFKPEQFEIFQALADQVAVALANILANEKILKREREKSVQLAVSNALTTIHDSEELIVAIAKEINKIIPNDAFSIHIKQNNPFLNLEFNDVRAIKENGVFVPLRRRAFWKSKGISEEKLDALIRESEPVLLEKAVFNDEKYIALGQKLKLLKLISDEFGFNSVIYAPVALQNGNLVTLTASSKQANGFTAEQLEKLCETGNQIALALESNLAFAEVSALKKQLEAENTYLAEEVKTAYNFAEIIGSAPTLQKVFRQIELVAPTDTTILLEGETGTGKELFARAVHDLSTRKSRPLIKINCASLPANLIESELFGHERGAFTGANERRIGKFELAHNGTIFLDEIGELPLELQAKLLRVLQEGEVERIGGKMPLKINLRVVAATNRNLRREVAEKRFRQDLYFRLNTVVLVLPSLRERREDVPALALYFAEKYGNRLGRKIRGISNKMLEALMNYEFPGNVRELEHIIEESVIFSKGETLQLHRPLKFAPDSLDASSFANSLSNKSLAEIEREHILVTLKQTGGRIRGEDGAAEILQIKPTTLEARMKKLGIKKLHINIFPAIK